MVYQEKSSLVRGWLENRKKSCRHDQLAFIRLRILQPKKMTTVVSYKNHGVPSWCKQSFAILMSPVPKFYETVLKCLWIYVSFLFLWYKFNIYHKYCWKCYLNLTGNYECMAYKKYWASFEICLSVGVKQT